MRTIALTRTGKTMPFLVFAHSSLNFAFAEAQFVSPSGHAERSAFSE